LYASHDEADSDTTLSNYSWIRVLAQGTGFSRFNGRSLGNDNDQLSLSGETFI
jgi:hypothetical protein